MAHQVDQQLELGRRERYRPATPAHLASEQVHLDVRAAQGRRRRLRDGAQLGAHASHELGQREGLDQVVHRARVESPDAILDLASSGQDDHRHTRLGPAHGGEDVKAAATGKHQVEHDRVEAAAQRQPLTLRPIQSSLHGKALGLQTPPHKIDDPRLVLDQEHTRGRGLAPSS